MNAIVALMTGASQSHVRRVVLNTGMAVLVGALFVSPYLELAQAVASRYLLADAAIVALVALRYRSSALERLGLKIPLRHLMLAAATFGVGLAVAALLVNQIALGRELDIIGQHSAFSLSQVLHQEIVLRGLLLGALVAAVPTPNFMVVGFAAVFAGIHPLFFWFTFDLVTTTTAIATLFVFGLATNILFVRFGHIAFSAAAHAAWNLSRFGDAYVVRGRSISEAQSFAELEGSGLALGASIVLLAIALATRKPT